MSVVLNLFVKISELQSNNFEEEENFNGTIIKSSVVEFGEYYARFNELGLIQKLFARLGVL